MSVKPRGYERARDLGTIEQVCAQVVLCREDAEADLTRIGAGRSLWIDYVELCAKPAVALARIARFADERGVPLQTRRRAPCGFSVAEPGISEADQDAIRHALRRLSAGKTA